MSSPLAQKGFREGHSRRLWGRRTLALEMEVQQEEERSVTERGGGEGLEEAMWKVERGVLRENRHHEVWRWRPKSKIFLTIVFSLQLRPTMSNRDNSSYTWKNKLSSSLPTKNRQNSPPSRGEEKQKQERKSANSIPPPPSEDYPEFLQVAQEKATANAAAVAEAAPLRTHGS